eukprot:TRINITY_DN5612_c0_g1_i1.p1 TRINITY_DN5612_c0_g1~~TRINITY_DN5612_c0_g1_i1.p1  ORF type:complete len:422 (-),score=72.12 TRINITY_DN5612_c0_g1_i1:29-1294(-)
MKLNGASSHHTDSKWSVVGISESAHNTTNPIRKIVDGKTNFNSSKEVISLSIGDPVAHGNLSTHQYVIESLKRHAEVSKNSGYPPSSGYEASRKAVADYSSTPECKLTANDVILTSGASGAIELAMNVLLNPGDNILLPKPGFSLYNTIAGSKGYNVKYYDLLPEQSWEVDTQSLRTLIDKNTKAILVNNPSNPCGSVYTAEHLKEILEVAEEFKVPIISDEIYAHMVFSGHTYYPLASLTKSVPILSIGGLAKRFLVPGWRLGWILVCDHGTGIFDQVRFGLVQLTQLILGPNSLIQSILPDILTNTPQSFFDDLTKTLETHSQFSYKRMGKIPGLKPLLSQGSMYEMVEIEITKFKDIADDIVFARKLLEEESVFVLPGQVFKQPNFFRVVFCAPIPKLTEAYDRLQKFCQNHLKEASS